MDPNFHIRYLYVPFRMLLAIRSLCMQTIAVQVIDLDAQTRFEALLTNLFIIQFLGTLFPQILALRSPGVFQ